MGVRKVISGSYMAAAFCAAAAGIAASSLPALLIGGALAVSCLDGIGSILRSVRTRERAG
jgi:hypothetical protein